MRLAADLHEGLGQELTGLALMLGGLVKRARAEAPSLEAEIRKMSRMASACVASARDMAHGMLPLERRHTNLKGGLIALARAIRRLHAVSVGLRLRGQAKDHPSGR